MRRHLAEARDEVPATVSVTTQLLHGRPWRAIARSPSPAAMTSS